MSAIDETQGGRGSDIVQAGEVRSSRLESLRALAALGVLVGHVFGYAHGFRPSETLETLPERSIFAGGFGVYLFFALSGYLIYWPFARRDFGGTAGIELGRYALNRALRILPLYFVAVIVVSTLSGASFSQWWHFLTFSENYFSIDNMQVDGPLWSVVVELQFYLLLPLLAVGIAWVARGSRLRGVAAIAAIGLASLLVWYVTVYRGGYSQLWQYNFPATFFFFTGGMLVAVLRTAWQERPPSWLRGQFGSSDLWLLAALPFWALAVWRYKYVWVVALPSALMVAACVLPLRPGRLTRILEWRWLALVGIASYSLYVWHVPILNALVNSSFQPVSWVPSGFLGLAVVAIPISLAVAFFSYRFIETPFLRLRRRWSPASAPTEEPPGELAPAAEVVG